MNKKIILCTKCSTRKATRLSNSLCESCYSKQWRDKRKKEKLKNCIDCNIDFELLTKKAVSGLCKTCYTARIKASRKQPCLGCGCQMINGSFSGYCKICKVDFKIIKSRTTIKKYTDILESIQVNQEQLLEIKILLIRFKRGLYSELDFFRVMNIYLDTRGFKVELEIYKPFEQVKFMLKDLKKIYELWKDRIYV